MSELEQRLEQRRRARSAIEQADRDMENVDKRMRANGRKGVPAMEATPEQLAVSRQQEITLNVEWVAAALSQARQDGWGACIDAFQPVIDYANAHPNAFDETVTDAELRTALAKALDTI